MNKIFLKPLAFITTAAICFSMSCSSFSIKAMAAESSGSDAAPRYTADDPLIVVSMGDSYSAGEGIEPFYGQKMDDNDENSADKTREEKVISADWIAHRSTKSWPSLLKVPNGKDNYINLRDCKCDNVKTVLKNQPCQWYFVAASGAEAKHFNQPQSKTIQSDKNTKPYSVELQAQSNVFADNGLKNNVDYITMSIGGNDLGFVSICINTAIKSAIHNPKALENELNLKKKEWNDTVKNNIINAYVDTYEKAGEQAEIIVAGYPELYYRDTETWAAGREQRKLVDNFVVDFCGKNGEIEKAIQLANFRISNTTEESPNYKEKIHYVSVIDKFREDGGHGEFAPNGNEWINGITLLGDQPNNPSNFMDYAYRSMHPNAEGAMAYAELVNKKIEELERKKSENNDPSASVKDNDTEKPSDSTDSTVYLEDMPLLESDRYTDNQGDSFIYKIGSHTNTRGNTDINGVSYSHGLEAWLARWNGTDEASWAYSIYDLDGKYKALNGKCVLIKSYNTDDFDTTLEFYGDNRLLTSYHLTPDSIPFDISVNVSDVKRLKVYLYDNSAVSGGTSFGLTDMILSGSGVPDDTPADIRPEGTNSYSSWQQAYADILQAYMKNCNAQIPNNKGFYTSYHSNQLYDHFALYNTNDSNIPKLVLLDYHKEAINGTLNDTLFISYTDNGFSVEKHVDNDIDLKKDDYELNEENIAACFGDTSIEKAITDIVEGKIYSNGDWTIELISPESIMMTTSKGEYHSLYVVKHEGSVYYLQFGPKTGYSGDNKNIVVLSDGSLMWMGYFDYILK